MVLLIGVLGIVKNDLTVQSKELTAKWVKQQKSLWCWAASAENSALYEKKKLTRHQDDAVKEIYGTILVPYPNCTGGPPEVKKAAEYMCNGTDNYSYLYEKRDYNFLKRQINIGNITVIRIGNYINGKQNGGHYVSVVGYDDSEQRITVYDSSEGKKVYTYNKLTNKKWKKGECTYVYDQTIFNLDRG